MVESTGKEEKREGEEAKPQEAGGAGAVEAREEKEKKVYTIRGLDPKVYEEFRRTAKNLGVTVGELMNEAMKLLMLTVSTGVKIGVKVGEESGRLVARAASKSISTVKSLAESITESLREHDVVSNIDELYVSKTDLEQLDKPIVLANIKKLVFGDDVDWSLLDSKVKSIKFVDEIVIPKTIPRILFAKKCFMVGKIIVKE